MDAVRHGAESGGAGRQIISHSKGNGAVVLLHGPDRGVPLHRFRITGGRKVKGGGLPLSMALGHFAAVVVIDRRAPEVRQERRLQHLRVSPAVGGQRAGEAGELHAEMVPADGNIPRAGHEEQFPAQVTAGFCFFHAPHTLAEGGFEARRGPGGILPQAEGDGDRVFPGFRLRAEGQRINRGGQRLHVRFDFPPGDLFPVLLQHRHAAEG